MIFHIAEPDNDFTLRTFVREWYKPLARNFQTIHTHQLGIVRRMPLGTYLFTDLERQSDFRRELQAQIYAQLREAGAQVLNDPARAMGRLELIRKLYDMGLNSYRAFPVLDVPSDLRFPVFLRMERDHGGSDTPLLGDWDEFEEAVVRLVTAGRREDELIAIEFCDTSTDEGLFVKYSAFRVGDRIVARGMYFNNDWMAKGLDTTPTWRGEDKWNFGRTNPHREAQMKVFEIANIEYGRIDYGVREGKIEVWEINTNPKYGRNLPSEYPPIELEYQRWNAQQIGEAFTALDTVPTGASVIPVGIDWRSRSRVSQKASLI